MTTSRQQEAIDGYAEQPSSGNRLPEAAEVTIDERPEPLPPTPTAPFHRAEADLSAQPVSTGSLSNGAAEAVRDSLLQMGWPAPEQARAPGPVATPRSLAALEGCTSGPIDTAFEATTTQAPPPAGAWTTLQASAVPDTAAMPVVGVIPYDADTCLPPYGTPPGIGVVALLVPPRRHMGLWVALIAAVIVAGVSVGALFGLHRSRGHEAMVELPKPKALLAPTAEQAQPAPLLSPQEVRALLDDGHVLEISPPPSSQTNGPAPSLINPHFPGKKYMPRKVVVTPPLSHAQELMAEAEAVPVGSYSQPGVLSSVMGKAKEAARQDPILQSRFVALRDRASAALQPEQKLPETAAPTTTEEEAQKSAGLILATAEGKYADLDWDGAIVEYRRLIATKQHLRQAYLGLAKASWQNGDIDGTIVAANVALRLGGGVPARKLLGNAYLKNGDYKSARVHYERVLKDQPDDPEVLGSLDVTLKKLGLPPRQPTP